MPPFVECFDQPVLALHLDGAHSTAAVVFGGRVELLDGSVEATPAALLAAAEALLRRPVRFAVPVVRHGEREALCEHPLNALGVSTLRCLDEFTAAATSLLIEEQEAATAALAAGRASVYKRPTVRVLVAVQLSGVGSLSAAVIIDENGVPETVGVVEQPQADSLALDASPTAASLVAAADLRVVEEALRLAAAQGAGAVARVVFAGHRVYDSRLRALRALLVPTLGERALQPLIHSDGAHWALVRAAAAHAAALCPFGKEAEAERRGETTARTDVTGCAIGVAALGGAFAPVLPFYTVYGRQMSRAFTTSADANQTAACVAVLLAHEWTSPSGWLFTAVWVDGISPARLPPRLVVELSVRWSFLQPEPHPPWRFAVRVSQEEDDGLPSGGAAATSMEAGGDGPGRGGRSLVDAELDLPPGWDNCVDADEAPSGRDTCSVWGKPIGAEPINPFSGGAAEVYRLKEAAVAPLEPMGEAACRALAHFQPPA